MTFSLASIDSLKEIYLLMKLCSESLLSKGINQWDKTYPSLDLIKKDISDNKMHTARENNEIVGVIVMDTSQSSQYENIKWKYNENPILVVHRLAVHPAHQNRGLGKKLMLFSEEYAQKTGFKSIRLDAYKGNKSLQKFYVNQDYSIVGEIDLEYTQGPFVCFEKKI